MGEIAEMVLEGILCEGCGGVVDGTASGYPRRCGNCGGRGSSASRPKSTARADKARRHNRERKERAKLAGKPFECHCGKLCRTAGGLAQHKRDKHGNG